jgi:peptide/nickel transport system permease protein
MSLDNRNLHFHSTHGGGEALDAQDLKWRHQAEDAPEPAPAEVLGEAPASGVFNLILRAMQRALYALLLILALIYFVSLASELGLSGGLSGFPRAVGSAWRMSIGFLTSLLSGEIALGQELWDPLGKSLGLLATALALGSTVGLSLGAYAALRRHSRLSGFLINLSVLGISTPSYVAAMFLIWSIVWLFQQTDLRILPVFGFGWDEHLILPTIVLAARPMANMMRLSYTALIDIFDADFVRTAHSKGLTSRAVFLRHILRNAGIPLLTTAGVSLRFSLSMLPIVEYIFTWPGVGLTLLQTRDTQKIILLVLPLAILFIGINLTLDILYLLIDPRLRSSEEGRG